MNATSTDRVKRLMTLLGLSQADAEEADAIEQGESGGDCVSVPAGKSIQKAVRDVSTESRDKSGKWTTTFMHGQPMAQGKAVSHLERPIRHSATGEVMPRHERMEKFAATKGSYIDHGIDGKTDKPTTTWWNKKGAGQSGYGVSATEHAYFDHLRGDKAAVSITDAKAKNAAAVVKQHSGWQAQRETATAQQQDQRKAQLNSKEQAAVDQLNSMTRDQWIEHKLADYHEGLAYEMRKSPQNRDDRQIADAKDRIEQGRRQYTAMHKAYVEQAVAKGYKVNPKLLAFYKAKKSPSPTIAKAVRTSRDVSTESRVPAGSKGAGEWTSGTNASAQAPRGIVSVLVSQIKADPARFQYKGNTSPITGAGEELKGVKKWDEDLAGVLLVWRDPANGKTFVVNGHHRFELARRLRVTRLDVRYIKAANAQKAMLKGALANVAEGRGTAVDAAKLMRTNKIGAKQLEEAGISLSGGVAAIAEPLTKLCDALFHQVATEKMTEGRGAIIAKTFATEPEQMALDAMLNRPDVKRKRLSDAAIGELKHFIQSAGKRSKTLNTLFGEESLVHSLAIEKAQLSASVKAKLTADKRLFGFVAKQGRAETLKRGGNVIATEKNKEIAESASRVIELYERQVGYKGIISTLLNNAAASLAEGGNQSELADKLYGEVRSVIQHDIEAGRVSSNTHGSSGREDDDAGNREVPAEPGEDGGLFKSASFPRLVFLFKSQSSLFDDPREGNDLVMTAPRPPKMAAGRSAAGRTADLFAAPPSHRHDPILSELHETPGVHPQVRRDAKRLLDAKSGPERKKVLDTLHERYQPMMGAHTRPGEVNHDKARLATIVHHAHSDFYGQSSMFKAFSQHIGEGKIDGVWGEHNGKNAFIAKNGDVYQRPGGKSTPFTKVKGSSPTSSPAAAPAAKPAPAPPKPAPVAPKPAPTSPPPAGMSSTFNRIHAAGFIKESEGKLGINILAATHAFNHSSSTAERETAGIALMAAKGLRRNGDSAKFNMALSFGFAQAAAKNEMGLDETHHPETLHPSFPGGQISKTNKQKQLGMEASALSFAKELKAHNDPPSTGANSAAAKEREEAKQKERLAATQARVAVLEKEHAATVKESVSRTAAAVAKPAAAAASHPPPISHKVGEDLYEMEIKGETVRGHWRSMHGHKIFLSSDGRIFQHDGYGYDQVDKVHPMVARATSSPAPVHIAADPAHKDNSYGGYDQHYLAHGLDAKQLEANLKANPPKGTADYAAHRAARKLLAQGYIRGADLADLPRALPHASYSLGAGLRAGLGPSYGNKQDHISASSANGAAGRLAETEGLTDTQAARLRATKAKDAAAHAGAAAKKAKVATAVAVRNTREVKAMVPLLQAAANAGDKYNSSKAGQEAAIPAIAAMMHAGLIREATRGATKGQLIVDTTVARNVASDPKASPDARAAAVVALAAGNGTENYGGHRGLKYNEFVKRYPEAASALASPERTKATVDHAAFNIAAALEDHGKESIPELQALQSGQGDVKAVAQGDKAAIQQISANSQAGAVKGALTAQQDEVWKAPKLFTMEGFGEGATLHGYQVKGVNWAATVKRGVNGFGTGLGKTLTALAVALKLNEDGKTKQGIIVVPVTKVQDFVDEALMAAPKAKVVAVTGNAKERAVALKKAKTADIVVMGASAIGIPETQEYIRSRQDASLQVDECHRFKRRGEGMTRNLEGLLKGREYAIGYTATPTPNYDEDFFNITDMFRPGCLGTKSQLGGRDQVDLLVENAKKGFGASLENLKALHEKAKPWVFTKKRTDPDVHVHVPAHLELEDWQDAPPELADWNHWACEEAERRCANITNPGAYIMAMAGTILGFQRQLAVSPSLMQSVRYRGDANAYTGPEPKIDECVDRALDHIGDATKKGQPFVVSCDFNGGLDRVRHRLVQAGIPEGDVMEYSGRTNKVDKTSGNKLRDVAKQRANDGELSVILLNTAAGGVGLNLQGNRKKKTGPSAMFILNEPWRDVDTRQVIDRVSRQGQQNETTSWVSRMRGTVDEKVHALVAGKGAVGAILSHGAEGVSEDLENKVSKLSFQDQIKMLNMPPGFKERIEAKAKLLSDAEKAQPKTRRRAI